MFLSPLFLVAAAVGAAVPLILHMMQTRRRAELPFPTLRFLQLAQKQSSRRIRMENFILWLIRTLIMALLGLAFAMPILRSSGFGWLGNAPRDVAIVIDASYSMDYNTGRETVWEKAVAAAAELIEGLGENDRYCLYLAREQPEALIAEPIGDKEQGIGRLESLEPGTGTSQLAPAVSAALKALKKEERGRELEMHVLTDNQALPWEGFGAGGAQWDPALVGERTAIFVTLLGVSSPVNAGPADINLQPAVLRPGSGARVGLTLVQSGEGTQTTAALFIDDEEISRRPAGGDGTDEAPTFTTPPLEVGVHTGRIETPVDNLPIDDAFHFLVRVEEQRPSLCVGSREDTLYIRTALRTAAGRDGIAPKVITPEQLAAEPLADYACVFLANALPLSGQVINGVEDYVREGGLLVIFPGIRGGSEAYSAWTSLPGIPVTIEDVPLALRRRTLLWDQPKHPMVQPLREAASVPPLTIRRVLVWDKLHPGTVQLISTGPGQPFLLERPFGGGRVLLFAVAADRTWSDFPLSPFYLPLLVQAMDYSAGLGARAPFHWATDSLPLTGVVPENARGVTLVGPDKRPVPVRSAVEEGRTVMIAEDVGQPGIYQLSDVAKAEPDPVLAINLPRRESDLTPLAAEGLSSRLGVGRLHVAGDAEGLRRLVEQHRIGRTYGEHLLWAALILIIIEFFLANLLLRRQPTLSEKLEVDHAGHIHGSLHSRGS